MFWNAVQLILDIYFTVIIIKYVATVFYYPCYPAPNFFPMHTQEASFILNKCQFLFYCHTSQYHLKVPGVISLFVSPHDCYILDNTLILKKKLSESRVKQWET